MFLEPLSLCAISVLEIFPLKVAIIHMGSFFCVFLRLSPDRVGHGGCPHRFEPWIENLTNKTFYIHQIQQHFRVNEITL